MAWSFLLSLSFYPDYFGFLAWFSLVRPLMIISRLEGRAAFNAAYFFGFFFNLFSIYWVAMVTPPGMVAAVIIVAFYYATVLMIFNRLYRFKPLWAFIAMPFLWTGMEYFRTLSELAFPWSDLGYTQSYYLTILQIVSVISVHGLSLLIVAVNILLWQVLRKTLSPERRYTALLVALAVPLALGLFGWIVIPKFPIPGKVDVALLQGSVPIKVKWAKGNEMHSFGLYDSLTQAVADTSIKLYVWPESSVPCNLSATPACSQQVGKIVRRSGGYHLVGALGAGVKDGKQRYFNSCYQFNPQGRVEKRHDKVKLVPFSEHVPYQDHMPFLEKGFLRKYLTFIDTYGVQWWSDFYPGDTKPIFTLPDYMYSVQICFESAFPEFVRETILDGADFIVGITNDTWFGTSHGTHAHSRIFLTRAVENRCWGIRVANSGLTYTVDGYGRIRDELGFYEVAALRGRVNPLDGYSIFTRYGDIAGRLSLLITVSLIGILIVLWVVRKFMPQQKA